MISTGKKGIVIHIYKSEYRKCHVILLCQQHCLNALDPKSQGQKMFLMVMKCQTKEDIALNIIISFFV